MQFIHKQQKRKIAILVFVFCSVILFSFSVNSNYVNAQASNSGTGDFSIQPFGPTSFTELLNVIITWIFNIAIPIAMIMIIWAGLTMLTAGGKPANYEKGKKMLGYAIAGLVVIFIGKGFISLVKSILELGQ